MGDEIPSGAHFLAVDIKQLLVTGRRDLPAVAEVFQQNANHLRQDFDYVLMRTDGVGLGPTGAYPQWAALQSLLGNVSTRMHDQLEAFGETLVEVAHDLVRSDEEVRDAFGELTKGVESGGDAGGADERR